MSSFELSLEEIYKDLKGTDRVIVEFFENYPEIDYQSLKKIGIFNKLSELPHSSMEAWQTLIEKDYQDFLYFTKTSKDLEENLLDDLGLYNLNDNQIIDKNLYQKLNNLDVSLYLQLFYNINKTYNSHLYENIKEENLKSLRRLYTNLSFLKDKFANKTGIFNMKNPQLYAYKRTTPNNVSAKALLVYLLKKFPSEKTFKETPKNSSLIDIGSLLKHAFENSYPKETILDLCKDKYTNINKYSCFEIIGDKFKNTGTQNKSLLHEAIKGLPKSREILETILLFDNLDVNIKNDRTIYSFSNSIESQNYSKSLNTPIMQVFRMSEILSEDYSKYLIDTLIDKGAVLDYKNDYNESVVMTAIHHGCLYGVKKCEKYLYPEILQDMYQLDGRSCWMDFDPKLSEFLYSKYPEMKDCNGHTYPNAIAELKKIIPLQQHQAYFDLLKLFKKEQFMKSLNKRHQVSDSKIKKLKVKAHLSLEIPSELKSIYNIKDFYTMLYKNNYNMEDIQEEVELFGTVRKNFNLIELDKSLDTGIYRDRKNQPKENVKSKQKEDIPDYPELPF